MARSALASVTATKVSAGSSSILCTGRVVNRHPDTLLHSRLRSLGTGDGCELSSTLTSSQFSKIKEAPAITTALYRHERLPLELLSTAAKSLGTRALLDMLQQTLDFCNLPGPVTKYLPAIGSIPLKDVGVLDLHIEAAAQQAVNAMLSSNMFATHNATTFRAAFFCVHVKGDTSTHYEPVVYCLTCEPCHPDRRWWSKRTEFTLAGPLMEAFQLPTGSRIDSIRDINTTTITSTTASSSSSSAGFIRGYEMVRSPAEYGERVSTDSHSMLFDRINTILANDVGQVVCNGRKGALQSSSFTAYFENAMVAESKASVWAVSW